MNVYPIRVMDREQQTAVNLSMIIDVIVKMVGLVKNVIISWTFVLKNLAVMEECAPPLTMVLNVAA